MSDYTQFIAQKDLRYTGNGIAINDSDINSALFPFQRDIVKWACRKGRCAIFLDTGLGKTHIATEWARLVGGRILIIAPLSVARQTVRLAKSVTGTDVHFTRSGDDLSDGINITNYELIDRFNPADFHGVVLDESSILKSLGGVTRRKVTEMFANTPYRLCCTATPAPNDESEIGNHAEFLGVMKNSEMLATFFVHANKMQETVTELENGKTAIVTRKRAGKDGQEWRLRRHGKGEFFKWLSSWSMSITTPSDLGYDDDGFILPALNIIPQFVDVAYVPEGQLFFTGLKGIQDRTKVRRHTLDARVEIASKLINESGEQWVVWCALDKEAETLHDVLTDSKNVKGSDAPDDKSQAIEDFQDGKYKVMITKPRIAGFGMNLQNAHNMAFVGLGDSWEAYYQCIRRELRYGQTQPVNVHVILSEAEREIYDNVMRKEGIATRLCKELVNHVRNFEREELEMKQTAVSIETGGRTEHGETWTAMLGDSCLRLAEIKDNSIDLTVYSPPFADLYTYSASPQDLGNSKDWDEFFKHYTFIISEVLRVTKPGRIACVHTSDIPALAMKDGYIGLKDFPGAVIQAHIDAGWIYHGYAVVTKNPQAQAIRTHSKGLLFVQLKKDSSCSRPCVLDRVLFFKKPGDSEVPVQPAVNGEIDNETWIDWAGGIWTGISESDTLNFAAARGKGDEKHICPLQLGTIERCIKLYSNPGEMVLTPFLGIGSEAYQAIRFGRSAIGIELKDSYFETAVKNLRAAEASREGLFNQATSET